MTISPDLKCGEPRRQYRLEMFDPQGREKSLVAEFDLRHLQQEEPASLESSSISIICRVPPRDEEHGTIGVRSGTEAFSRQRASCNAAERSDSGVGCAVRFEVAAHRPLGGCARLAVAGAICVLLRVACKGRTLVRQTFYTETHFFAEWSDGDAAPADVGPLA